MKIILDAMGGDNAPQAIVEGALEAHAQCGAEIALVGREEAIRACLTGPLPEGVEIVNATEVWRCATILPPLSSARRIPP